MDPYEAVIAVIFGHLSSVLFLDHTGFEKEWQVIGFCLDVCQGVLTGFFLICLSEFIAVLYAFCWACSYLIFLEGM